MDINKLGRIKGNEAWFGGVCAGIARFLKIPAWIIRIAAVLLFLGGVGFPVLIYLLLWAFLPVLPSNTN